MKFGQNPMSGFRGEDVKVKKFTHAAQLTTHNGRWTTMNDGQRPVTIAHPELKRKVLKYLSNIYPYPQ